jgi:23S rRNA (uracil1939-C5)-methyltransferase
MVSDGRLGATLRIERVVAGGDGLAREDGGRVVFVPGGLPGETVEVRLVGAKRDFARSVLTDVIEASPHRVVPPCRELARGCGGCDWQHVEPSEQLILKGEIVREALRRTAKMPDAHVALGGSVSPWAYRTSMRFAVDDDGRATLHMARSDDTVSVDGCLIAHPRLVELLPSLRLPGAAEVSLRVAASSGQRSAWWTPADVRPMGLPDDVATGSDAIVVERVAGVDLRISASSFFQSGPRAAELLVETVRALAGADLDAASTVVDAYGGVGLFAACAVSPDVATIVVEGSPSACDDARHNLAGRATHIVESRVEDWQSRRADVVIADPSRRGLGAAAIERLVGTRAGTLVLVSCDPVALARDAALLAPRYRLVDSAVLDLFPHSHHVEVVSRFERHAGG